MKSLILSYKHLEVKVKMKITILGSGNGGTTVAADMALMGHEVSLFDFAEFPTNIEAINRKGGIETIGKINGFAKLAYAGNDVEKAIDGAEMILAVGPAYSTASFAKAVKPYLKKNQIVCVCPSSGAGAIIFKEALGLDLNDEEYIVCETSTLPYATRLDEPGKVNVYHKLTGGVYLATIPAKESQKAYEKFKKLYPYVTKAKSLLMTMLQTGNNIIHPSISLLNASRIESTQGDFGFYEDGATPAAGKLMKAIDDEKMKLSAKLDIGLIRDPEVKLLQEYNVDATYENGYRTAPGFKGIKAQSKLDNRYFNEDVGYGLVFISELSKQVEVETPIIDAIILIVSKIMERDYRAEGKLTPKVLGLDQYSTNALKELFCQ